ncbi:MAG: hypothetical protein DRJ69_00405 [Thermoprotei archaeon]|nr:MAG: hypothetical protein DRJ69_00405 [Thermoprotei archaeon]
MQMNKVGYLILTVLILAITLVMPFVMWRLVPKQPRVYTGAVSIPQEAGVMIVRTTVLPNGSALIEQSVRLTTTDGLKHLKIPLICSKQVHPYAPLLVLVPERRYMPVKDLLVMVERAITNKTTRFRSYVHSYVVIDIPPGSAQLRVHMQYVVHDFISVYPLISEARAMIEMPNYTGVSVLQSTIEVYAEESIMRNHRIFSSAYVRIRAHLIYMLASASGNKLFSSITIIGTEPGDEIEHTIIVSEVPLLAYGGVYMVCFSFTGFFLAIIFLPIAYKPIKHLKPPVKRPKPLEGSGEGAVGRRPQEGMPREEKTSLARTITRLVKQRVKSWWTEVNERIQEVIKALLFLKGSTIIYMFSAGLVFFTRDIYMSIYVIGLRDLTPSLFLLLCVFLNPLMLAAGFTAFIIGGWIPVALANYLYTRKGGKLVFDVQSYSWLVLKSKELFIPSLSYALSTLLMVSDIGAVARHRYYLPVGISALAIWLVNIALLARVSLKLLPVYEGVYSVSDYQIREPLAKGRIDIRELRSRVIEEAMKYKNVDKRHASLFYDLLEARGFPILKKRGVPDMRNLMDEKRAEEIQALSARAKEIRALVHLPGGGSAR